MKSSWPVREDSQVMCLMEDQLGVAQDSAGNNPGPVKEFRSNFKEAVIKL